jgi:cell division protein FtsW
MQRHIGTILLLVILGLAALGLVMLFSTSAPVLTEKAENAEARRAAAAPGSKEAVKRPEPKVYDYLKKQSIWFVVGAVAALALVWLDYHWLTKHAWVWLGFALFLCVLVFVPHLGTKVKGASRWIAVGGFTLQPSELAKMAVIIFMAGWFAKRENDPDNWIRGLLIPSAVVSVFLGVFILQHDLGYTFHLGVVFWCMLVCAGTKWRYTLPIPLVGLGGILLMALAIPERRGRLLAFMDPEKYALDKFWQQGQALIAFGSGGLQGLGLGNSRQKMFYVPEAHNDFILPILGEELGLVATLAVVFLFLMLMLCAGWISLHAPDREGHLLGLGLTVLISVQALMNMLVVTAMAPNKGVPLPFISYGGSNLLMMLMCIGVLFNLHRQCVYDARPRSRPLPTRVSVRM